MTHLSNLEHSPNFANDPVECVRASRHRKIRRTDPRLERIHGLILATGSNFMVVGRNQHKRIQRSGRCKSSPHRRYGS